MITITTYQCEVCDKIDYDRIKMICHTNLSNNYKIYLNRGIENFSKRNVYEECFNALMESFKTKYCMIKDIDYMESINCFDIWFKKNYPEYNIKEYLLNKYKESKHIYSI